MSAEFLVTFWLQNDSYANSILTVLEYSSTGTVQALCGSRPDQPPPRGALRLRACWTWVGSRNQQLNLAAALRGYSCILMCPIYFNTAMDTKYCCQSTIVCYAQSQWLDRPGGSTGVAHVWWVPVAVWSTRYMSNAISFPQTRPFQTSDLWRSPIDRILESQWDN